MKKYIYGLLLAVLSRECVAGGWTPELTVNKIFTEDTDIIVAYTDESTIFTPGCQPGRWIFVASNDDRRNRAYSTMLAALMSGKKIQFWYQDDCAAWSYHKGTSIMIVN